MLYTLVRYLKTAFICIAKSFNNIIFKTDFVVSVKFAFFHHCYFILLQVEKHHSAERDTDGENEFYRFHKKKKKTVIETEIPFLFVRFRRFCLQIFKAKPTPIE